MNNKKYEDYHVLDEETDNLDLEEENKQIPSKSVEIEPEADNAVNPEVKIEVMHDPELSTQAQEVIDVEVIEEGEKGKGYTSVLEDIEDEEFKEDERAVFGVNLISKEKELEAEDIPAQVVVYKPVLTEDEDGEQVDQEAYTEEKQRGNHTESYQESTERENNYNQQANQTRQAQEFNDQYSRDTSFSSYVEADKKRERSFFVKWGIRFAKLILFIMLLPVIGVVSGGVLFIAGSVLVGILACIGGGIFILGTTCFVATQVNTAIIALGISLGITAISFGGIVLVICMMLIKKINQLVHEHRVNKKNRGVR